jgi:large subunit ribosomal protein L10
LAITREKKGTLVEGYVSKLQRSQAVFVSEYRGLTVKQIQELRRELRNNDSELIVAKNTLIRRALNEVGLAAPELLLKGPTAVTICYREVAGPAKALNKFARDSKILVVKGGVMGQSVFNEQGVDALSNLPGREQLLGQVVGTMQAPISGLVNVLAGTVRSVMNVLNARARQLEGEAA